MIGVNAVPPIPPSALIVIQPPCISLMGKPLVRARSERVATSTANACKLLVSQSRMTATNNPLGVSTATPMWKYCLRIRLWPEASSEALKCGNTFRVLASALI
ncbi:hypothetical protein D3C85_1230180 [compost metagenome]